MMGVLFRAGVKMLALAGLLYATFFHRLGDYTFYEHGRRIARTPEARQLYHELEVSLVDAIEHAGQAVGFTEAEASEAESTQARR